MEEDTCVGTVIPSLSIYILTFLTFCLKPMQHPGRDWQCSVGMHTCVCLCVCVGGGFTFIAFSVTQLLSCVHALSLALSRDRERKKINNQKKKKHHSPGKEKITTDEKEKKNHHHSTVLDQRDGSVEMIFLSNNLQ